MTTMIGAIHGTGNIQSAAIVVDMAEKIAYLEPDENWVIRKGNF